MGLRSVLEASGACEGDPMGFTGFPRGIRSVSMDPRIQMVPRGLRGISESTRKSQGCLRESQLVSGGSRGSQRGV